ncbi:MAG: FAD-binding oxidoreductase [Pseudomonadota bacterium]
MADDLSSATGELTAVLRQVLGPDGLVEDDAARELMSQDIWAKGDTADFVAAPETVEQVCEAVAAAHARGVALNPRGGGMSYTKGYTPDRPGVGVLDLSRLNRIVEINTEDMYVTVEAGCTWKDLNEALAPLGLRTPFWGPLSGITSTIGGGLSQNNAFFGAGTYGPTSDSVTSVAVVLADGTLVRTGTAGTDGGKPFWRHYGPDLTGLFLGDAGALGHKVEATFRLIPAPEHEDWASFEFDTRDACAQAMADVARQGLACEVFGFDPNLTKVRLKRASLMADTKTLVNVVKGQGSLLKGIKEGAKIAVAGRGFVDEAAYTLHLVVEGRSRAGVTEDLARVAKICEDLGGKAIENSIPKIIRSNPFTPLNNMLGPEGERWVPVHGIVPLSEGPATWAEIEAVFDDMRAELDAHHILTGYLITSLSTNGYLIEPVFIWPEELFAIHEASVEADYLKRLPRHDPNPEATAVVTKARQAVVDVFTKRGGAHFQIGRTYPYAEHRAPGARDLIDRIKAALDPGARVNPGALGLG